MDALNIYSNGPPATHLGYQPHRIHWKVYVDVVRYLLHLEGVENIGILCQETRRMYSAFLGAHTARNVVEKEDDGEVKKKRKTWKPRKKRVKKVEIVAEQKDEAKSGTSGDESEETGDRPSNAQFYGYQIPTRRLAYLATRVPRHMIMIGNALEACRRQLWKRFAQRLRSQNPDLLSSGPKDELVITSIGGGPGSDFLGFLRFFSKHRDRWCKSLNLQTFRIRVVVIDSKDWAPLWPVVQSAVAHHIQDPWIQVDFVAHDATKMSVLDVIPAETDLFVFSYFINEMVPFGL